ncbi:MAG: DUF4823 domain-containing protein [Desulfosarcina sp.]|nr:DUF4823 domain-containing protein [Desulfosarcina sp.]MBC2742615.1 DUF4823 domain-containing protein [Desulfosarcina sp.]MBC2765525.1 DUF4823 domain-containing protein [Desulfosarcina sp.]
MKYFFMLIISLAICNCAPTSDVSHIKNNGNDVQMNTNATAYISLPEDRSSNGHLYAGSGREVAVEIEFIFSKYLNQVVVGNSVETFDEGLLSAKNFGYIYFIHPQLIQWEDYATQWSGIPDKLTLKVTIVSVESGAIIDKLLIDGKGPIVTLSGGHPLDISKKSLEEWVKSLF